MVTEVEVPILEAVRPPPFGQVGHLRWQEMQEEGSPRVARHARLFHVAQLALAHIYVELGACSRLSGHDHRIPPIDPGSQVQREH